MPALLPNRLSTPKPPTIRSNHDGEADLTRHEIQELVKATSPLSLAQVRAPMRPACREPALTCAADEFVRCFLPLSHLRALPPAAC